jgi:4-amino-4-deoxy-L-arabinose transferase-like glycosyltransferase
LPDRRALRRLFAPSPFWGVFAVALVARLLWIAFVSPRTDLVDDSGYYDYFAVSIAEGRGYVRPEGVPTAFWPVGYPGALAGVYAVVGHSLLAAKLLNVILGAFTAGLVYLLARRWFGTWQSAAAGLIFACFPGAIGFTSLTMSETLFTFLFVAAMYVVARAAASDRHELLWAVGFAVFAAGAAYVRGQALALPFFAAAWLLIAGWGWQRAVSFLAVSFAVVIGLSLPWIVRNTVTFGEPTFMSTNAGINLWLGHNPEADGGFDYQLQLWFAGQFNNLPREEQESAWNREGFREAVRYAYANPLSEVRLSAQKVARLYMHDHEAIDWNEQNGNSPIFSDGRRLSLQAAFDAYYYAVGLAAFAGFVIGLRQRKAWVGPMASAIVLWTLIHVIFFAEPRQHVPVLPFFAIAATVAAAEALRSWRAWQRRPALATASAEPATRV